MALGLSAGMIGLIGAGASIVGGALGAGAASDASQLQAQGTRESNALQERMFNKNIELQEPFRQTGLAAQNKLSYLLGLSPNGFSTPAAGGGDYNALRTQFLPQFTKQVTGEPYLRAELEGHSYQPGDVTSQVDEAGLSAAINSRMAEQSQQTQTTAPNDPSYGSLMRDFSMADFQADPGYQFRMDQGQKALERSAAARGLLGSGKMLKDLTAYGQGQGAQEYQNAYNRFQTNRTNKLNPLQSLGGVGQTAANTMSNLGTTYAGNVGNNITNNANAQGAAQIARGSSWTNALNNGVSNYQGQQFLNKLQDWSTQSSWRDTGNGMPPGDYRS